MNLTKRHLSIALGLLLQALEELETIQTGQLDSWQEVEESIVYTAAKIEARLLKVD